MNLKRSLRYSPLTFRKHFCALWIMELLDRHMLIRGQQVFLLDVYEGQLDFFCAWN